MALVGKVKDGSDIFLFLYQVPKLIGCANSAELNVSREVRDVRCKSSGKYVEKVKGQINWQVTLEGIYKVYTSSEKTAGNVGADDMFEDLISDEPIPMKFGSTEVGDPQWAGQVLVVEWTLTGSNDGEATYNVTMEGTGELVMSTVAA